MITTTTTRSRKAAATTGTETIILDKTSPPVYPDIQTIRDAIPAHCFQPSTARSLGYVVRDVTMAVALGYAAFTYIPTLEELDPPHPRLDRLRLPPGPGLHGHLDPGPRVRPWRVQRASWKFSHHRHHRFTGHMEKDMAFVPHTKADRSKRRFADLYLDRELFEDVPVVQLVKLVLHQLAGWQMYLAFNVSSGVDSKQKAASWWRQSHFEPTSAVFRPSEAVFIALADLGLAIVGGLVYMAAQVVGWKMVFVMYIVPYMWVHHWLVAITYLHHTHPEVHHFEADSWTFVKGALATVDRDFGFVGRHLFHGIIDTHVVHHLFPRIPFYKAEEATEALKPLLGDLYHREESSFVGSLWRTWTKCKYVEADPAVPGALIWAPSK
ncbi:hypothetical protein N0V88_007639 [Collariella sp. IMI 366227]|nr:hypothetical protein N0V88_007639 [Collariella sp. IMI 366227]